MMGPYAEALSVVISLAFLLVFYVLWRDYWVDEIRDDLFALRDNMFVFAYENGLITHPAYTLLRELMNSVIRYSHDISGARFLMLAVVHAAFKPPVPAQFAAWNAAVASLPIAQRDKLVEFHRDMAFLIGRQVFKTSMLLRAMAYLLGVFFWLVRGNSDGKKELADRMPLDLLEQDALATAHS
ncbi:MAG: hypothetical protein JOZ13_00515 [Alphaproteobacteria bacterium]|nr:hypothetical protein [Alphaproteobacteria bacterium]